MDPLYSLVGQSALVTGATHLVEFVINAGF
jgi:hypothetical protein